MKAAKTYTQFFGTERPGVKVTTITDLRLNNRYLTFLPARDDLMFCTIPKNTQGTIAELHGTIYKLNFNFTDPGAPGMPQTQKEQQAMFYIRLRDFEKFFKKL